MNEWWQGLAPAQAVVDCGGNRHRLRWDAGALHALDHGDVESERTLAALGGQRCACLDLIEAWERHHDDLRVLVLGSRGPTDILAARDDPAATFAGGPSVGRAQMLTARANPGWAAYAPSARLPQQSVRLSQTARAENELVALLGIGGGVPERLVATVAAAWRERIQRSGRPPARSRAQLQAALHGRVFAVMRSWLGAAGPESRLVMIGEKGKPKLIAEQDSIRVELPFGWLVNVWAQGLALVWGRFCLSASTDDGRTWRLATVGPDFGPPSVVTVALGT